MESVFINALKICKESSTAAREEKGKPNQEEKETVTKNPSINANAQHPTIPSFSQPAQHPSSKI
jgi:hypothetical protein